MKFFLTSAYNLPSADYGPKWLLSHAESGHEKLAQSPQEADVILFVERFQGHDLLYEQVYQNPCFKAWPDRCILYHPSDTTVTFCRTITPSNDRRFWGGKNRRTFHYVARFCENETINASSPAPWNPRYLYSFQGAGMNHAVRQQLLRGTHPKGVLVDHGLLTHHAISEERRGVYEKNYVETILASQFVLCPRGFGPCSYRLFETMQLGRVPVIISDDWVPIQGVPWEQCSLTVRESEVDSIPVFLEQRASDAKVMGQRAREVWEEHFSPAVSLKRMLDVAAELAEKPYETLDRAVESLNLLRQPFVKIIASRALKFVMRRS